MELTNTLFALLGAVLFAMLFRGKDLIALSKKKTQHTPEEKEKIKAGLARGLAIEFFILVPASTLLTTLIFPLLLQAAPHSDSIKAILANSPDIRRSFYVVLGMISYNFPFATVRQIATRLALNTIKEFYELQQRQSPELAESVKPGQMEKYELQRKQSRELAKSVEPEQVEKSAR